MRERADQGCVRQQGRRDLPANRRRSSQSEGSREGQPAGTAAYLRQSADLIDVELAKLRKLAKPKADRERLSDLLSREGDAIAVLGASGHRSDAGSAETADTLLNQAQGELSDVGAGLHDYGFTVCGT